MDATAEVTQEVSPVITAEVQAQAEETFKLLHNKKLGEGVIPIDDIGSFFRAMGCNPSLAQLTEMKEYADPDSAGVAKLPELIEGLEEMLAKPTTEEQIQNAFSVFDKQGKGVSLEEMRYILTTFGEPMSAEEADELLQQVEEKCNTDELGSKTKLVAPTAFCASFLPQAPQ